MHLNLVDVPGYWHNATELYDTLTRNLNASIVTGNFTESMKNIWLGTSSEAGDKQISRSHSKVENGLTRAGIRDIEELDILVKEMKPEMVLVIAPPSFVPTEQPTYIPSVVPSTASPTMRPSYYPSYLTQLSATPTQHLGVEPTVDPIEEPTLMGEEEEEIEIEIEIETVYPNTPKLAPPLFPPLKLLLLLPLLLT